MMAQRAAAVRVPSSERDLLVNFAPDRLDRAISGHPGFASCLWPCLDGRPGYARLATRAVRPKERMEKPPPQTAELRHSYPIVAPSS